MKNRQEMLCAAVEKHTEKILAAERYVWKNPEVGFREWNTTAYYKERFEALGYTIQGPTDIPGFFVDLDTGISGPKILVLGELDALPTSTHPEAVNGLAHACGHHIQCAGVYGLAAALKEPGVLDGLCGSIRMMLVPAEESDISNYREELRASGVLQFVTGKMEYMRRGYMDGCDIAFMFHAISRNPYDFSCDTEGSNGVVKKTVTIRTKMVHGSRPDLAVSAMGAAGLISAAINALQETFRDEDHLIVRAERMQLTQTLAEINVSIRGASQDALNETDHKVNRAICAAAAIVGAEVEICNSAGYSPVRHDPTLLAVAKECLEELVGADKVNFQPKFNRGASDLGDLSCVIPCIHPFVCGSVGGTHSDEFRVADPIRSCVNASKAELLIVNSLLSNGAKRASEVMMRFEPMAPSFAAHVAGMERRYQKLASSLEESNGEFSLLLRRNNG